MQQVQPGEVNQATIPDGLVDLQILIGLKWQEFERAVHDHPRERMQTADHRWADIEVGMRRANIDQKAPLICKKWEKLMTDFKKVFDYQRSIHPVKWGTMKWVVIRGNNSISRLNLTMKLTTPCSLGFPTIGLYFLD